MPGVINACLQKRKKEKEKEGNWIDFCFFEAETERKEAGEEDTELSKGYIYYLVYDIKYIKFIISLLKLSNVKKISLNYKNIQNNF